MNVKVQLNQAQLVTMNLILQQKNINQVAQELKKTPQSIRHHFNKLINNQLIICKNGMWCRSNIEFEVVSDNKLYGKKWRQQHDINWELRHLQKAHRL